MIDVNTTVHKFKKKKIVNGFQVKWHFLLLPTDVFRIQILFFLLKMYQEKEINKDRNPYIKFF